MKKQRSDPWKFLPSDAYHFNFSAYVRIASLSIITKKHDSPACATAVGAAVLFCGVVVFFVVTMMEQKKKYIDRITHFIVCGITAYFMRFALFVLCRKLILI